MTDMTVLKVSVLLVIPIALLLTSPLFHTVDLALVAFYHEFKFQYIDPSNGYYFTNCYVADLFCSGVHLVNVSASSELQTIIFGWNFLSAGGGQVGCGVFCASHFTVSHSCIPGELVYAEPMPSNSMYHTYIQKVHNNVKFPIWVELVTMWPKVNLHVYGNDSV